MAKQDGNLGLALVLGFIAWALFRKKGEAIIQGGSGSPVDKGEAIIQGGSGSVARGVEGVEEGPEIPPAKVEFQNFLVTIQGAVNGAGVAIVPYGSFLRMTIQGDYRGPSEPVKFSGYVVGTPEATLAEVNVTLPASSAWQPFSIVIPTVRAPVNVEPPVQRFAAAGYIFSERTQAIWVSGAARQELTVVAQGYWQNLESLDVGV